jgi:hypothetical protein
MEKISQQKLNYGLKEVDDYIILFGYVFLLMTVVVGKFYRKKSSSGR